MQPSNITQLKQTHQVEMKKSLSAVPKKPSLERMSYGAPERSSFVDAPFHSLLACHMLRHVSDMFSGTFVLGSAKTVSASKHSFWYPSALPKQEGEHKNHEHSRQN